MFEYTATLLFLLLPCLGRSQLYQVCDSSTFGGSTTPSLPFPDIPSQFSTVVEANLVQRSETIIVSEYYDQVGDRGRLEVNSNNTNLVGIFDYNLGEIFIISGSDRDDCRVFPTTPGSGFFLNMAFGFEERNGTIHIGSPAAALIRIQNTNASTLYLGEDTVRGVPVHHWQSCVSLVNNSYLLDYFFTRPSWSYASESSKADMVLVQITLNASFVSRHGVVDNAHHIYSFVDFQSGPDSVPDEVFTVPSGLACKGRIPGQAVPELPDTFSGRVEFIYKADSAFPVVVTLQEFYDFRHSLFRVDYYDKTGPVSIVHDFNEGLQYRIEQAVYTCNITRLNDIRDQLFDADPDSIVPQLSSPSQLYRVLDQFNYSYEGVTKVREIDVDYWVSVRDSEKFTGSLNISNATYEIFFSRPGWVIVNGHSVTTKPVPLKTKISGIVSYRNVTDGSIVTKPMSLEYEIFDISDSEPPYDAFDISPCFSYSDLVNVVLVIPGQLKGLYLETFRKSIRASISNYTGVSPLQVASIELSENETDIFIHVHIANISSLSTSPQEKRVTSSEALAQLVMGTQNTVTPFLIQVSGNVTVAPSLHTHGQGRRTTCDNPTTPPTTSAPATPPNTSAPPTPACNSTDNNIQNQLALKNREVVGIAIGLLFGGILIGIALGWLFICICRCACKGSKSSYDIKNRVKYQKHDDDVAVN